jgi:hypothetical protein
MAFPAIGAVLGGLGAGVAAIGAADLAFRGLANSIGNFTEKSNPAQFQRLTLVMNDMTAALGVSLEPLMESFISIGKKIGDTFAGMQPVLTPLAAAFGSLAETFVGMLLPVVENLAVPLAYVAEIFKGIAEVMQELISPLRQYLEIMLDLFGLTSVKNAAFDKNRSAVGSAARNFRFVSSGDELQRNNAISALRGAPSMQEKAQAAQVELPGVLKDILAAMKEAIKVLDSFLKALAPMTDKERSDLGLDEGMAGKIEGILAKILNMMQK